MGAMTAQLEALHHLCGQRAALHYCAIQKTGKTGTKQKHANNNLSNKHFNLPPNQTFCCYYQHVTIQVTNHLVSAHSVNSI